MIAVLRVVRDWITTLPTLVAFGLTLVVFDVAGRIALLFGRRPFEWTMAALQWTLLRVFSLSGVRYDVEGTEHLPPGRSALVVSNHQSMLDIPMFGGVLLRNFPKYVAKQELGRGIPAVSLNLRRGGNALIDRGDRAQAVAEIRRVAAESRERGTVVVLFPEGTRSRTGELRRFRRAGAEAMFDAAPDLPVIPAAIDGTWKVFERNMLPIPFGTRVRVRFGPPIPREGRSTGEVLADARAWIEATLAGWRGATADPPMTDGRTSHG